jgi:hypothetical protein
MRAVLYCRKKEELKMLNRRVRKTKLPIRWITGFFALFLAAQLFTAASFAQAPPSYSPQELERLVSRIALYPDPLLAQILTASTFPNDIPAAAQWADEHHYLTGDALAQAIAADQLPWDPSVQALLPFPSVLDMMASDMAWTQELGDAVLAQQPDVMDAVQRMRRRAADYGYLRSNPSIIVGVGPYITIMPVNPGFIVVPYYNPAIVFAAPRIGFAVGAGIRFGFGVAIGLAFRPWGWGMTRFNWGGHGMIVNDVPWRRNWANRATYVHPYTVRRFAPSAPRPPERHELERRSPREREDARAGRAVKEEHAKAPEREKERNERR